MTRSAPASSRAPEGRAPGVARQRLLAAAGPVLGVALLAAAALVLHLELEAHPLHDVVGRLREIPGPRLGLALVLTALGYLSLTGYDALGVRYVRSTLPYRRIALASVVAYAFSHNVGLSFLGGGAVRYRMFSRWGLRTEEIARAAGFGLLTFWLGFLLVGGVVHALRPLAVALPGLRPFSSRPLGLVLLAALAGYLALVARRRAPLRIHGFSVELPRLRTAGAQLAVSAADWLLAAAVLDALLPSTPDLDFATLVGAYVLAVVVGLASHVPAGLGVFEGAMLVLLRGRLPADKLLAGILAYRIVYDLLPMLAALGLLAAFEARQSGPRARKAGAAVRAWVAPVVPRLFAVTTFLAGAVLLLSGATPELPARLRGLRELLPLPWIELSKLLGSVFGVLLLLLANALRQRIDAAYYATLALLAGGAGVSLLKGLEWEEAALLAAMGLALLPCKAFFDRRSSLLAQPLSRGWWMAVAALATGVLLTLEIAYRQVDYAHELWWRFDLEAQAPRSLRAAVAAGVTLLAVGLARLLRPAPPPPDPPTAEALDRAQAIVARQPRVDGYLALLGDKRLLFHDAGDAFLMFGVRGRTWVAMGDPVGPPDRQEALAWRFRELADRHGARCAFYEVSEDALAIYLDLGLDLHKLGEAGRVALPGFSLEGRHRSDLRRARSRMAREGCRLEVLAAAQVAPLLGELRAVSDAWLRAKQAREKGFSLGFFDAAYLQRLPLAVVRRGDSILAFANLWPSEARQECSIDLMRHRADAPRGVMDFLFAELMLRARDEGYRWFSLGMAPLSGFEQHRLAPLWNRLGALLFRHGEHFYNFRGLREFKEKFDPSWEPRYLAAPGGLATPLVLTRVASLVADGLAGVVRR